MLVLAEGEPMPVDGTAAAARMRTFDPLSRHGACLYYVWQAFDQVGANTRLSAGTAMQAWNLTLGKHKGDRNPPAGACVWWGKRHSDGNTDGDVVISLGGGRVIATDQPTWGRIGECTIQEREQLINREYLGWTDHIFDVPISLPTPASDSTPVNKNEGDDDMAVTGMYKDFWAGQPVNGDRHYLWLDKKHHNSIVIGPTRVLGGTIALDILTTKAVKDAVYVVEGVIETIKNGKVDGRSPLHPHEIIPTTGHTFQHVPFPGFNVTAGRRLRFYIHATGGMEGKIVSAVLRGQQIKG